MEKTAVTLAEHDALLLGPPPTNIDEFAAAIETLAKFLSPEAAQIVVNLVEVAKTAAPLIPQLWQAVVALYRALPFGHTTVVTS